MLPRPSGIVALLTDFGTRDPYIGLWKGMLLRAHGKALLVDLTHDVEARDVALSGFFLRAAVGRFPTGSTFVAVVDPSASLTRRTLAVLAYDCYWIGPDNGVLSEILAGGALDVRQVDFEGLGLAAMKHSYLGRDAYAPLAGG
ncbi:MAG: SAM-dependent chlorinase/fluorinase, partial [Planctomycetota bacterium]